MEKKTVKFTLEKATKNTIRYTEKTESAPIINTLYVQKWYLGNPAPKELKVTIEQG